VFFGAKRRLVLFIQSRSQQGRNASIDLARMWKHGGPRNKRTMHGSRSAEPKSPSDAKLLEVRHAVQI